jgi:hypothetical protein
MEGGKVGRFIYLKKIKFKLNFNPNIVKYILIKF